MEFQKTDRIFFFLWLKYVKKKPQDILVKSYSLCFHYDQSALVQEMASLRTDLVPIHCWKQWLATHGFNIVNWRLKDQMLTTSFCIFPFVNIGQSNGFYYKAITQTLLYVALKYSALKSNNCQIFRFWNKHIVRIFPIKVFRPQRINCWWDLPQPLDH